MALVRDSGGVVIGAEVDDLLATVTTEWGIEQERSVDALVGGDVDRGGVVGCVEERREGG